jgi:hypothetical protein
MPLQWDGLPAHRSNAMRSWLNRQRWWLVVERLPGYAGAEPGRGAVVQPQGGELTNLTGPTLAEVIDQAYPGIERVRRTPHLAYSFLRRPGLSVS